MSEIKTWRILIDPKGTSSPPLLAEEIAARLWTGDTRLLWAEPCQLGQGAFPQDVPEVRAVLLQDAIRLARAWLRSESGEAPPWVFVWVMDLCRDHPEEAWPLVMALVSAARGNEELALVAAGPLEALLANHGESLIQRVEAEAGRNPWFRRALAGVWRSSTKEVVWERLVRARGDDPGHDDPEDRT